MGGVYILHLNAAKEEKYLLVLMEVAKVFASLPAKKESEEPKCLN